MTYFESKEIFSYTMPLGISSSSYRSSSPSPRHSKKTLLTKYRNYETDFSDCQEEEESSLELWISRSMHAKDISGCSVELLPSLIESLNRQWEFMIENGYYFESENICKSFKTAVQLLKTKKTQFLQNQMKEQLKSRKEAHQLNIDQINTMANNQNQNMEYQFTQEIENMMNRHDMEIEELNSKWESNEYIRLYNKSSAGLNLLRTQETKLLFAKRYDESLAAERQANEMEKIETQRQIQKRELDYQAALSTLLQRQRKEFNVLLKNHEDLRNLHENAKKQDEELIGMQMKKIDLEMGKIEDLNTVERRKMKTIRGPQEQMKYSLIGIQRKYSKAVDSSEFNKVPLPALNANERIQREILRRANQAKKLNGDSEQYQNVYTRATTRQPLQKPIIMSPRAKTNKRKTNS